MDNAVQTPSIVPQPTIFKLGGCVLRWMLAPMLEICPHAKGLDGLVMRLSSGGPLKDNFTVVLQALDIGRDRKGNSAVAIADVRAHHASITVSVVA